MGCFLLIFILLIFPVINNADNNGDSSISVTQTSWFWPLLSICLALLLSIPCVLITVVIFCYNKNHSDDSDESSISSSSSSSSSSTTPVQRRSTRRHFHPQCPHYAGGFRSPPPPYPTSEYSESVFVTPSLPPPYESHVTENNTSIPVPTNPTTTATTATTIINVEPTESIGNQSSNNPTAGTTLDLSSTLTSPSIQTFQV